ncbi:MAG: Uma2 family endonuclease [Saprospiraceae bacterium]
MVLHEPYEFEALDSVSDYEIERNKPMPSLNHSIIQLNLGSELRSLYKNLYRVASELSLDLADWPSVPDICIFPKTPLNLRNDIIAVTEPPLCAIEIISPSQSADGMSQKVEKYFQHGVQSCWIVFPAFANIYVYSSPDDYEIYRAHETLQDAVLGISLPLKEVFE